MSQQLEIIELCDAVSQLTRAGKRYLVDFGYENAIEVWKRHKEKTGRSVEPPLFTPRKVEDIPIPSWDELFMREVYAIASKSKDPRSKIGAVLVYWSEKDSFSRGYNDFPRKVNDRIPSRWERPEKYFWVCHAETNAILHCARAGRVSKGATLFTQGVPCADCTKNVIQAGIVEIVVHKQWQEYEQLFNWAKWNESSIRSEKMLKEANIPVRIFNQGLDIKAVLDGKVINV